MLSLAGLLQELQSSLVAQQPAVTPGNEAPPPSYTEIVPTTIVHPQPSPTPTSHGELIRLRHKYIYVT